MRLSQELRQRTKQYASAIIRRCIALPGPRKEIQVVGHQLLRSGTSVAAHIREASRASNAEFCSKLDAELQEADESGLWLKLLRDDCGTGSNELIELLANTNELMSIFVTVVNRTRRKTQWFQRFSFQLFNIWDENPRP